MVLDLFQNMRLATTIPQEKSSNGDEDAHQLHAPAPALQKEAVQQIERENELEEIEKHETAALTGHLGARKNGHARKWTVGKLIEMGRSRRTIQLLLQIWQSDYSIIAFVIVM